MAARWRIMVAFCLLVLAGAAQAGEPVKIRIGWITVPTSLSPILFAKPQLATHLGKSYTVEPTRFAGTSPMITALATGDLDIGELAFASLGFAIQNARLSDLRIIADEIQDGVEDHMSLPFVVLKDGPIRTIEDLKGKTVATNVIGSGTDIGMRSLLRHQGLEAKRDYTIIESDYGHMPAMLAEGKADMIVTINLTLNSPQLQRIARPLFSLKDAMGTTQILSRVARTGFIEKNRTALVDYFEDEIRELRWYLDPANHDEAVRIVADFTKLPPEAFAGWIFTAKDQYRDPDDRPNLEAVARNLRTQKEAGFLDIDIDVAKYADLSLVEEAARRLNKQ
jgi:sulfonate transport system substrate-binding protein